MHNHILAAYDGSVAAGEACRWAAAEAERRKAALMVVRCFQSPIATEYNMGVAQLLPISVPAMLQEEAERSVAAIVDHLRVAHRSVSIDYVAFHGNPRHDLVAMAEQSDLLVAGTTGMGRTAGWAFGSVAQSLARHAPCPVALVPAVNPLSEVPRIVVGFDGSASAGAAVDWAVDEADLLAGELVVVHAWSYPYFAPSDEPRDIMRVDGACALEDGVQRARSRAGCKVEGVLREGRPAEEIVGVANDADLIVVGSRGHGSVRSLPLGSVSREVIANAPCVVVVTPHVDQ